MAIGRAITAPGQLGLVQSFLNTIDLETGRDDLADLAAAQGWLAGRRLISPGTEYDEADRRRLVEVRRALHGLVAANGGGGVQRRAVTTLNEAARRVRLGVRLHPEDGYRLMAEGVGIDRPIGELLISVTASMAAGSWSRLKICANDACQEAFFDSSKNRSARWCSMARCGNRMKGRAYRNRQVGRSTGSQSGTSSSRERAEAAS
ncbi:MAG: CGNR zinc finger domain-containing protein [Chloroflexota bacterium]